MTTPDTASLAWELEQTSQALAALRDQVRHEETLLATATTALRLCRQALAADHCPACAAAASFAATVLAQLAPTGEEDPP